MAFLSSFNIAGSGLTAQRLRLDTIAENISNMNTTRTENGETYRRKMVVLQAKEGTSFAGMLNSARKRQAGVQVVDIIEDESDLKAVYNPDHPDAGEDGYVMMPNVDLLTETADSMEATRAYNANITAFNAIKAMAQKALEIGV